MQNKFLKFSQKNGFRFHQKKSLLAISGGRDSMALLKLFVMQQYYFEVAHVNFGLRKESFEESDFIKSFCEEHNILCHIHYADTIAISQQKKTGIQETARHIRYDYFNQILKSRKLHYIVTAHHADDQLETFLMRLAKGVGINGLSGIPARNTNTVRPLLNCTRDEITNFCQAHQLKFYDDTSNEDTKYHRNKIRHELIPILKTFYNSEFENIYTTLNHIHDENEWFYPRFQHTIQKFLIQEKNYFKISIARLTHCKPQSSTIFNLFNPYGFTAKQTGDIIKLLTAHVGRKVVSDRYQLIRDRQFLFLVDLKIHEFESFELLDKQNALTTEQFSLNIKPTKTHYLCDEKEMITVDEKKLKFPLAVRTWQPGDYFYPRGINKKKKVSDFLIDHKIPIPEKNKIKVLLSDFKIVWILGYKMDARFASSSIEDSLSFIFKEKNND